MWWDFFKLFTYSFELDPLSKKAQQQQATGAGVSQPDAVPNIRGDGSFWGGNRGLIQLRDSNDFIDLSSVTSRMSRYKEYERLRNVAEIEQAMTVFADESCISGNTKIATPFYGYKTIRWLAEHKKDEPFLVYCWDFDKEDFTLGWAYDPRVVKKAKTLRILLDNGTSFVVTPDHRVLLRSGEWTYTGHISEGDELMPFYRERAQQHLTKTKTSQFPRIFTFKEGWKHERQFIDEWRTGKSDKRYIKVNQACRLIAGGATVRETAKLMGHEWFTIDKWMKKEGFSVKEMKRLAAKRDRLRVIGVQEWDELKVYDLSVKEHENFCTNTTVMHNCQRNDEGHVFKIDSNSDEIKKELEFLFFHRGMLNMDRQIWQYAKKLFTFGDLFLEVVISPEEPKEGILKLAELPPDSVYRIETTKGKVIEFQQSKEGPDFQALTRVEVTKASQAELQQATAIRFTPHQVIHFRIGDDRKTFYPYGQSLIEPARGPAHQLRLMEDAMVVYRLCLAGDTRVRTKDGWKYIKDIKIGDDVFSYLSKDGVAIYAKVVNWENNGRQKTYKVRSKHIEITGNDKHPILVERDGKKQYVKIKDLTPKKDKLINVTRDEEIPVKIPKIFGDKWAKLDWSQRTAFRNGSYGNKSELMRECSADFGRVKQFLYAEGKALPYEQAVEICDKFDLDSSKLEIVNKGQINSERINLPEYVNEDFARLFGFLIGDGSIRGGNIGYGNQLLFAAGTDKEQNRHYSLLMKKFFGRVRFEKDKRSRLGLGNYVVDSQVACRIMHAMGYIKGAYNKRIPKWVFTAPNNIRRAFVEGISSADGCERYTKAGTWFSTIELCNKKLIADIKEVWHSIGLCSGKLGHRKRSGDHEIEPGRKMPPTECYGVTITDCTLPETENIWSVEEDKEQDVFDLTVDHETHNFIANGCPVSNTRAPERRVFYIDVGQLAPFRAEAFIERMKDQFRKKKVSTSKGGQTANSVEERWHAPAADEDYWLPIRPNSNTRIDTLPGACLALDTRIPLLDGSNDTLDRIIERWNNKEELWAYSCNPHTGEIVPGPITWAGVTRKNTQVMKLTFDNGESIVCTPDHKFPVIGKEGKTQAKDIEIGDSLIPFRTRKKRIKTNTNEYLQIYDACRKEWKYVHRVVANYKGFQKNEMVYNENYACCEKDVIHHRNFDRFDNRPENLVWMHWRDHLSLHQDAPASEYQRKRISEGLRRHHNGLSFEEKRIRNQILSERSKLGTAKMQQMLQVNDEFRNSFTQAQREGWKTARQRKPEVHSNRSKKISKSNKERFSNAEYKKRVFDKQTVKYPDSMFDMTCEGFKQGLTRKELVEKINNSQDVIREFVELNKNLVRSSIRPEKGISVDHFNKMVKNRGYNGCRDLRIKLTGNYVNRVPEVDDKKLFGRVTLTFPKKIFSYFMHRLSEGEKNAEVILEEINSNFHFMEEWKSSNANIKRKGVDLNQGIKRTHILRMVRSYGYNDLAHARKEAHLYNHTVVSIEFLDEKQDVGTITIDGNEELHDYHTFAVSGCEIMTYNSNLGEIDDALYFRNKLLTALGLPKNFFANDDPQATRITLSAQDVRFARMIERLQQHVEDGLLQIAERHLELRGYPEPTYENLKIKMTPPSDWKELSRAEVVTNRISNANSLKGSLLLSDYDILTRWMQYSEDESQEMIARMKIQKLEDLKLQVMAQNPQLMGIGVPGDGETELGAEAGGPSPMLGPGGEQPPGGPGGEQQPGGGTPPGPEGQSPGGPGEMPGAQPPPQGGGQQQGGAPQTTTALPDAEQEYVKKYDLEIEDYASQVDEEEIDWSTID